MGLEIVEIVTEVERRLGVDLSSDRLAPIRTVGELADVVVTLRSPRGPVAGVCPTLRAFLRVRAALVRVGGASRGEVTPRAFTARLVAPAMRRALWRALADEGLPLAPHEVASPVCALVTLGLMPALVLALVPIALHPTEPAVHALSPVLFAAVLLVVGPLAIWAADRRRTHVPADCETVAGITRAIVLARAPLTTPWAVTGVREEVRRIVADQLGLRPDEVGFEARFSDLI